MSYIDLPEHSWRFAATLASMGINSRITSIKGNDHIRFRSAATAAGNTLTLSNWSWKAQLTFGVRLGAGRDRLERALGKPALPQDEPAEQKKRKLPIWLTDFFWSPK